MVAGGVPKPRLATLRTLHDPRSGLLLDRGLVLFFPEGASFTGEDIAELHLHGGRAVVAAVLEALASLPGMRPAEAGEFTRRAFAAGRMDLTEAEGLADLVSAETEMQRRLAVQQAGGLIRDRYEGWRGRLIRARAMIEAELDFSDEEGVAGAWSDGVRTDMAALREEIGAVLADGTRGERLRSGADIVILGAPNVGKSSLLNAIARRDAAIVSAEAGTTRDVLEIRVDVDGYAATLVDTAGLREADGDVEREGIRRARARADTADLVLWLWERQDQLEERPAGDHVLEVLTKADVVDSATKELAAARGSLSLSALTGEGVLELLDMLGQRLATWLGGEAPLVTRARHRQALSSCQEALSLALSETSAELAAEHLRRAGDELGRVTGRFGVEDLLDVVFRDFCIGK